MKKRVLVTGGAGYVGSILVNMLLDRGYNVVVLDKLLYGKKGYYSFRGRENLEFIHGDVTDIETVRDAVTGVNCVVALAAIVGDQACAVNEDLTWDVNYNSIKLLADEAIRQKVQRFVFTSSCSVYGCNGKTRFLSEDAKLFPVSLYARTRIKSEEYLKSKKDKLSSVILRLSTVFGLSPRMRFDLVINVMTAKAVRNSVITVEGGNQWRPFVHVRDVARAIIKSMEADDAHVRDEVFNVGCTDSNYQISELAQLIAEEVPGTSIVEIPHNGDSRNYNCTFDKIHKRINFKSEISVRDGVREIARYVKHLNPLLEGDEYSNFRILKDIANPDRPIPYSVPEVAEGVRVEIMRTIESGWLSMGPRTRLFEQKVKEYLGDKDLEVIAVSSCTAGLHLQLLGSGIGKGDEVITTPLTFCATVNTILYCGATPVLVDIDPETFNIDINLIEERITERTKAIVPVYYSGQAVDHKALRRIADRHKLLILADAAHAIGARYDNLFCGTYEDSAAFSFYATKNMPIGEGGIVTTHNKSLAERVRALLLHGMNKDAWKRFSQAGSWYYEIEDLGYKYNFTDMQAAIGLHQLCRLDHYNSVRRAYCERYDEAFRDLQGIKVHRQDPRAFSNRHMYPIVIDEAVTGISRDIFIEKLKQSGIGTSVHYIPIHYHPYYQKRLALGKDEFPVTNRVFSGLLSLPVYPLMRNHDVNKVIARVTQLVNQEAKVQIGI